MKTQTDIVRLEDVFTASQTVTDKRYKKYVNPPLQTLLSLIGADRHYIHAQGVTLRDVDDKTYLDFLGAYGALNLGHNHPELEDALQLVKNTPNFLQSTINPFASALAETLANISPGALQKTFFCNSGTEAVEAALKLARAGTGRMGFLSTEDSFHGKTFGALSVTGRRKYQDPFEPLLPGCCTVPYGDLASLQRELESRNYAAFIVEPIQGEGGIILPPDGYLKAAERLCKQSGTLFVLDEIQTGLGRTGHMFASEYDDLQPDILVLAKSLGGGVMPIGACMSTTEVWMAAYGDSEKCLLHTSTFGGNTRACAVALKTIEILLRDNYAENARINGKMFIDKLKSLAEKYPLIREVRGRGLMIGIELHVPVKPDTLPANYFGAMICGLLLERHNIITAFTLNKQNVIRVEPPLLATPAQLDTFVEAMTDICDKYDHLLPTLVETGRTYIRRKIEDIIRPD